MEKNSYLKIQQAARRSRVNLISQILYLILFLVLSGVLLSRVVPAYYYEYFSNDTVTLENKEYPDYLQQKYMRVKEYSKWERYRDDWFEVTQSNLIPEWSEGATRPFGKTENYNLYKQIGFRDYQVAKVSNDFMFDKVIKVDFQNLNSQREPRQSYVEEWDSDHGRTSLDYLKESGKYRLANIKVNFKTAHEKVAVDDLFEDESPLEVIRYGVDYPVSETLGYPKFTNYDSDGRYEISEADFLGKLANLQKEFPKYGNLHLYDDEFGNTTPAKNVGYDLYLYLGKSHNVPGWRVDFADVNDYIKHNGVKYKNLLITGDCLSLAAWLEVNQEKITSFEIEDVVDWNG